MRKSTAISVSLENVAQYPISVSLGRSQLPLTIIEVNEDTYTFEALFISIQGGRFDAVTDLKSTRLRSLLGHKRDEISRMRLPVYKVRLFPGWNLALA